MVQPFRIPIKACPHSSDREIKRRKPLSRSRANNIVALDRPLAEPHPTVSEFHLSRQQMLRMLAGWMHTHPATDEVQIEIDGTLAAMRGLLAVLAGTADA